MHVVCSNAALQANLSCMAMAMAIQQINFVQLGNLIFSMLTKTWCIWDVAHEFFAVQPFFGVEHSCHNLFKSRFPAYSTQVKHIPKIAPKSDDKDNHCLVYLDTSPFTTVFFFLLDPTAINKRKEHHSISSSISWSQIFSLNLQFASYFFTDNVFVICSLRITKK